MSNFMMNMISWVLLLLVILTLYLIDKINHLSKMYDAPKPDASILPDFETEIPGDLLFSGLEGKKLWDAMNGKEVEGFDASMIEALRPHYEPILREHITATFKDGLEEVGGDESKVPSSLRKIETVRGHIQSWLPPQHLGSIYRSALEFAGTYANDPNADTLVRLKQTVDSVVDMLYQRVSITNEVPFSDFLFDTMPIEDDEPTTEDAMLALTDQSARAEVLGDGLLEDSNERELTPQELAQGLEHAQAYEDAQRQEIAAETVEAVMIPESETDLSAQEAAAEEASLEVKPA
ncbi:MAG: hypothetical protein B7Y59_09415 [Burkholderiales bacterium 35-55-47]|jgi:hypothetical protein|uniref:hypothetical protein n=1 Tax=Limnohabitans sp. TaxID=1907725 RepID=UPI000BDCDC36|nr:hypothetical protein [Limnohabitans sp.]OYY18164.1 MAG: hypothetical protein B7Y59_09415 [Burkholderiales bacterium 35-55-47]OYZ72577.1 MAG: hypothetical protein B7Y06_10120 [Burkholderiales bacterium 24-55-52]OZB00030.1 MAG: hypothetical protein B7X62_08605 [Burkholderiales bacterium 39-55-53]HQR87027.1 hypothetical protein [Limnohabitans sp.]HQS26875.1 hypothetical protein [Limnohabitans sp.]